ncbi:AI-2E family transporter [uncultured Mucilaginibacter sp.]|uniref:AI-2E family transporter n=1 Tax=uncultured Mucilaginibacter sp. TaxID=797541 RepID=UPI00261D3C22|nr:AI-2E family transporter [uncultured Mucilaginibacter sp.]
MKKILPLSNTWASSLLTLIALGFIVVEGKLILCPLVFSMLFSLLLLPVGQYFELRFKMHRSAASMMAILMMLTVVALVMYLLGSQIADLLDDWPQIKAQLARSFYKLLNWIKDNFNVTAKRQMNIVDSATNNISAGGSTTTAIGITVLTASSILLFWVFAIIDTFFLLIYRRLLFQFLIYVFKKENAIAVFEVVERIKYIITKYITGLMLEMMVVSTASCTVFLIGGVKYALLLGLITGIFNIIPYVGIASALLLSTIITISTAAPTSTVVLVISTIVVIHLIDSNILLPMIVGSQVRINALITILGVILGEMLWGIPGMFLSIPVIAVLKIIFDRVDSLQPWGLLLGDETMPEDKVETRVFVAEEDKPEIEMPES